MANIRELVGTNILLQLFLGLQDNNNNNDFIYIE